ncbi:hypothetical protein [Perigonia lusca single nucleopolyhedrovirus]|uniref:Uncharacterized protein n=1 Tax=Perigonia lusca single nucleopolyhedrovirus TaxID=1675865 RepID=A0A0M3WPD6_9ABAC|nr:hypothetical protein [Perigonia lusca single nucleopolyhedrovirus]AKN80690.1 hypothetical protein [Perigonia lusca single nucleopolyhedrovirus]
MSATLLDKLYRNKTCKPNSIKAQLAIILGPYVLYCENSKTEDPYIISNVSHTYSYNRNICDMIVRHGTLKSTSRGCERCHISKFEEYKRYEGRYDTQFLLKHSKNIKNMIERLFFILSGHHIRRECEFEYDEDNDDYENDWNGIIHEGGPSLRIHIIEFKPDYFLQINKLRSQKSIWKYKSDRNKITKYATSDRQEKRRHSTAI